MKPEGKEFELRPSNLSITDHAAAANKNHAVSWGGEGLGASNVSQQEQESLLVAAMDEDDLVNEIVEGHRDETDAHNEAELASPRSSFRSQMSTGCSDDGGSSVTSSSVTNPNPLLSASHLKYDDDGIISNDRILALSVNH